jgi:translation elongation factor P/translation initiation factor 5A
VEHAANAVNNAAKTVVEVNGKKYKVEEVEEVKGGRRHRSRRHKNRKSHRRRKTHRRNKSRRN